MALLGIDLGTSSVKALLLAEDGTTISLNTQPYAVTAPQEGWSESDPTAWWDATVTAVRTTLTQAQQPHITAIGLSGQMHGVVLADEQGAPVRAALLWPDTRAEAELQHYYTLSTATRQRLANPLVPGMAGPLLLWLAHHEKTDYQATRWALQPKDWLRYRLTKRIATEPGDASGTLLYDVPHDQWDDDAIATLGLRRDLFPEIIPSAASAGQLTTWAAAELGLIAGTPVATGTADTAAAALGTGLLERNTIQLTLGTGAQLIQLRDQPGTIETSPRTHLYRAATTHTWYTMAAVQNAGLVLDWIRRTLNVSWNELYDSAATIPPGSQGLIFLPYMTRERAHQPVEHTGGAFLNMRIGHTREHLLHATLEGVAFGIRMAFEALPGASMSGQAIRLAGGGSVHPAWRQMLADILARDLEIIDTPAASARGAALLAGIVGGTWADATATAAVAPGIQQTISPDMRQSAAYTEAYTRFVAASNTNG